MSKLVIIRHGESIWNLDNRFTGWVDVDLTQKGISQANAAGQKLKDLNIQFDIAYTSVLQRAIKTLWNMLSVMEQVYIPIINAWELNERHYGALTGLDKAETARIHGDEQLKIWRRSYNISPPVLDNDNEFSSKKELKYSKLNIDVALIPDTECLEDTLNRVLPYFITNILPHLLAGKNIIISAHGNSLRALIKYLNKLSESEILELNLANAQPLMYDFANYNADMAIQYTEL
jgi:2,3-bisphosphoglycerate-dependent phosphoglycerate mutase